MSIITPAFEGSLTLDRLPEDFRERVVARVDAGLFMPGNRQRANYAVQSSTRDRIVFSAQDMLTAFNVGLNQVTLHLQDRRTIRYAVEYRLWARYCSWLCLIIAALAAGPTLIIFLVQRDTAAWTWGLPFAMGIFVFWGLVWPWLLVALHKRPARRCLERILLEICGEEATLPLKYAGKRYVSRARLFGVPLVCIAIGPAPEQKVQRGIARGIVAVGDIAIGFVAVGGVACGGIAVGGLAVGLLAALGGCALGGAAIGGVAIGGVALGGVTIGALACGGLAIGLLPEGGLNFPWAVQAILGSLRLR